MFVENLTDAEISEFMKQYVKQLHVNLQHANDDCIVHVGQIERIGNTIKVVTQVSEPHDKANDNCFSLIEKWAFTPYCAMGQTCVGFEESLPLLKQWSKFVYVTLGKKDAKLARVYKKSYTDYIKGQRKGKIINAKNEYAELSL